MGEPPCPPLLGGVYTCLAPLLSGLLRGCGGYVTTGPRVKPETGGPGWALWGLWTREVYTGVLSVSFIQWPLPGLLVRFSLLSIHLSMG